MTTPQWEDCKVCGGDHWTRDHGKNQVPAPLEHEEIDDRPCPACGAAPDPAPLDEPDPNRLGMPKCQRCGDIAYRPDPIGSRLQAWRCGGCHYTLGRCKCAAVLAIARDDQDG